MKLVRASLKYFHEIKAYRAESLAVNPHINGASRLAEFEDPARWVAWCDSLTDPAKVPTGQVPGDQWMLIGDRAERVLGMINIRHSLGNAYLREFAGHIGYAIRPSERGRGLAKVQLLLGLEECRKLGISEVLLTCDENNEASRRTILACGGVYERRTLEVEDGDEHWMERYWISLGE